jgi:soluble lytic murein transglycosylase-like protein
MILRLIILAAICLAPFTAHSGIYGYVDDEGVYHFTNIKPANKTYQVVIAEREIFVPLKGKKESGSYDKLIVEHSRTHGMDPSLIKAVVKAESDFNPNAVSNKGAQGLMQLMPGTARLMNVDNPFDPDENIKGGTKYLKQLDDTFQGNLELVLAAYNAGPQKVIQHNMTVPPIEETKSFIKRVKFYYNKLRNAAHEG